MRILVSLGVFLLSGIALAMPLKHIVVFGDSLSDNGNLYEVMKHQLPQSPPYFEGRFSNGPVWIEHLLESYSSKNLTLENYAYGGAGVSNDEDEEVLFTLDREIKSYLLSHEDKASEDSLYVIWIGANNYLGMPEDADNVIKMVNTGIKKSLQQLANKGAKNFLIINLPDLGKTPAAFEFNAKDTMSYFSEHHNAALAHLVTDYKDIYPDLNFLYFDANSEFNQLIENAISYGITNTTGTCVNSVLDDVTKKSVLQIAAHAQALQTSGCDGYLFFDLVHPTALAHKIFAQKARIMLDASKIEFVA